MRQVGAGRIFRVLYPVGKATHRVHILAGRTVKQGHRRFAQHKGILDVYKRQVAVGGDQSQQDAGDHTDDKGAGGIDAEEGGAEGA